jgi:hypothetical protein
VEFHWNVTCSSLKTEALSAGASNSVALATGGAMKAAPTSNTTNVPIRRSEDVDIRSELESARRILGEAAARQSFWNPEQEQLPAARWDDHRQTVAGEDEVMEARAAIEDAYPQCNRLNQNSKATRSRSRDANELESDTGDVCLRSPSRANQYESGRDTSRPLDCG